MPKPPIQLDAVRCGDVPVAATGALASLVQHSAKRMLRNIRPRISKRLQRDVAAEDILQESLLVLLHGDVHSCDIEPRALIRRLSAIAENKIRSAARRPGHRARQEDSAADEPATDSEPAELRAILAEDDCAVLRRHLAQLALEHRMVLTLRHWLTASWETTALVLGRSSVHAAQCLHHRALQSLERKLTVGQALSERSSVRRPT